VFLLVTGCSNAEVGCPPWAIKASLERQVVNTLFWLEKQGALVDAAPHDLCVAPLAYCALYRPEILGEWPGVLQELQKARKDPEKVAGAEALLRRGIFKAGQAKCCVVATDYEDGFGGARLGQIRAALDWLQGTWVTFEDAKDGDPLWRLIHEPSQQHVMEAQTWAQTWLAQGFKDAAVKKEPMTNPASITIWASVFQIDRKTARAMLSSMGAERVHTRGWRVPISKLPPTLSDVLKTKLFPKAVPKSAL
jgi:hypothetical protein